MSIGSGHTTNSGERERYRHSTEAPCQKAARPLCPPLKMTTEDTTHSSDLDQVASPNKPRMASTFAGLQVASREIK